MMQTADLGLGTTYERFATYEWLASVADGYPIRAVLEGPGDGVAGIPGIHGIPLAQSGCEVTVALEDPAQVALAQQAWAAQGCLERGRFICWHGQDAPVSLPTIRPMKRSVLQVPLAYRFAVLGVRRDADA
jgi:hypothetical protein